MSKFYGNPPARIVSVEQSATGVGRMVIGIPMVLSAGPGGVAVPQSQRYAGLVPAGWSFAGASGKQQPGGQWEWQITLEGAGPLEVGKVGGEEDQIVYAFEPSDAEVPLTSHPDVLDFIKNWGGRVDENTGRLVFGEKPPTNMSANDLVGRGKKNPFFGVEAYMSFGGTWTKTYLSRGSLPGNLFDDVETVVSRVPSPPWLRFSFRNRSWLKRMPGMRVRGRAVEISERYLLSGRGGHNKAIYSGRQGG
jgi:hypothetical protein